MCEEKQRLLVAYDESAAHFAECVSRLSHHAGSTAKTDYEEMLITAERARLSSENARLMLDQHVMKHRC